MSNTFAAYQVNAFVYRLRQYPIVRDVGTIHTIDDSKKGRADAVTSLSSGKVNWRRPDKGEYPPSCRVLEVGLSR